MRTKGKLGVMTLIMGQLQPVGTKKKKDNKKMTRLLFRGRGEGEGGMSLLLLLLNGWMLLLLISVIIQTTTSTTTAASSSFGLHWSRHQTWNENLQRVIPSSYDCYYSNKCAMRRKRKRSTTMTRTTTTTTTRTAFLMPSYYYRAVQRRGVDDIPTVIAATIDTMNTADGDSMDNNNKDDLMNRINSQFVMMQKVDHDHNDPPTLSHLANSFAIQTDPRFREEEEGYLEQSQLFRESLRDSSSTSSSNNKNKRRSTTTTTTTRDVIAKHHANAYESRQVNARMKLQQQIQNMKSILQDNQQYTCSLCNCNPCACLVYHNSYECKMSSYSKPIYIFNPSKILPEHIYTHCL